MKRKLLLFLISIFIGFCSSAQNVGINPTGNIPNASAGLDIDFSNKGLLIPRVALTARNNNAPIGGGIANSLLVYNTATNGTYPNNVYPGYYYWDGTQWQRLMNGAVNDWQVTGNTLTGTLPNTPNEFIGTLNNADFIFKTNNIERMRILSTGSVIVNNTTAFAGDVFSSYSSGSDWAVNGYNTGSGGGIFGSNNANGFGVFGQNTGTGIGVYGITTSTIAGVYGQGPNIGTYGLSTGNNGTGLFGVGPASVTADGVNGLAGNNQAMGGVFFNSNATGTGLLVGGNSVTTMSYQPSGSAIAATSTTIGIVGYGTSPSNGNGICASGNNLGIVTFAAGSGGTFQGQTFGVTGVSPSTSNNTWGGYFANGTANGFAYVGGTDGSGTAKKIIGGGSVSTIIKDLKGNLVSMTCPEAPEILFEDYGIGQLINGKAHIDLDPVFAKNVTINEKHPLRVFIQLEGDCNGVYVTNKTQTGFDVVELNSGQSNVKFAYHVVANRADDRDENGNIVSINADIRFSPAPSKQIPIEQKSASKQVKVPDIQPIGLKKSSVK